MFAEALSSVLNDPTGEQAYSFLQVVHASEVSGRIILLYKNLLQSGNNFKPIPFYPFKELYSWYNSSLVAALFIYKFPTLVEFSFEFIIAVLCSFICENKGCFCLSCFLSDLLMFETCLYTFYATEC